MRLKLANARRRLRALVKSCEGLLDEMRKFRTGHLRREEDFLEDIGTPHLHLLNAMELSLLFRLEASALTDDLLGATGHRRAMYTRLLVLVTYESLRTLRSLLGGDLRREVVRVLGDDYGARIKAANQQINSVFDDVNAQFKEARNWAIGHRVADRNLRAEQIASVDEKEAIRLSVAAYSALIILNETFQVYSEECVKAARAVLERKKAEMLAAKKRHGIGPAH